MKSIIIPSLCLSTFLVFSSAAQTTFKNVVNIDKSYGTAYLDESRNGNYLISMKITVNKQHNTYCARINDNGETAWEKIYRSDEPKTVTTIAATSDNGFVVFAKGHNTSGILFKCDSLGSVQWSKKFTITDTAILSQKPEIYPVQIIEDIKGHYVLLYQLYLWTLYSADEIHVLKFDHSGNLIFQSGINSIYDPRVGQYLHVQSLCEGFDGSLLIGFHYQDCAICQNGGKPYLIRMDREGNVVSYRKAPQLPNFYDNAHPYFFSKNGRYFMFETYYDARKNNPYFYLAEFDKYGIPLVAKFIPDDIFALQQFARENDIHIDLAGLLVNKKKIVRIIYEPKGTTNNETVTIKKYDEVSRICPDFVSHTYSYDTASKRFKFGDEITGAQKITDNLLVEDAGIIASDTSLTELFCSGKAEEIVYKLSDQPNGLVERTLSLYPNPAKNEITFSWQNDKREELAIKILKGDGIVLQSSNINAVNGRNCMTLNISSLTRGIYFLKISSAKNQSFLKFIKE